MDKECLFYAALKIVERRLSEIKLRGATLLGLVHRISGIPGRLSVILRRISRFSSRVSEVFGQISRTRWLFNGRTTPIENGGRFRALLVCAGSLLTGWEAAFDRAEHSRTLPDLPEQTAFHPVSRQPAQTTCVGKRLPFSLWIRPDVAPPLESPCSPITAISGILEISRILRRISGHLYSTRISKVVGPSWNYDFDPMQLVIMNNVWSDL